MLCRARSGPSGRPATKEEGGPATMLWSPCCVRYEQDDHADRPQVPAIVRLGRFCAPVPSPWSKHSPTGPTLASSQAASHDSGHECVGCRRLPTAFLRKALNRRASQITRGEAGRMPFRDNEQSQLAGAVLTQASGGSPPDGVLGSTAGSCRVALRRLAPFGEVRWGDGCDAAGRPPRRASRPSGRRHCRCWCVGRGHRRCTGSLLGWVAGGWRRLLRVAAGGEPAERLGRAAPRPAGLRG
jgi:hypothetical protein